MTNKEKADRVRVQINAAVDAELASWDATEITNRVQNIIHNTFYRALNQKMGVDSWGNVSRDSILLSRIKEMCDRAAVKIIPPEITPAQMESFQRLFNRGYKEVMKDLVYEAGCDRAKQDIEQIKEILHNAEDSEALSDGDV